jgi:predicted transcriptional regulator
MTMTQEHRKRLGRPPKPPTPGTRVALGLKVTPEIKRRLDQAARKSGRTQSQQAELMIERSFAEEDGFGGPEMRRLAYLMTAAFATAGRLRAGGKPNWIEDSGCYRAGMFGVIDALLIGLPDATAEEIAAEIEGLKGRLLTRIAREEQDK